MAKASGRRGNSANGSWPRGPGQPAARARWLTRPRHAGPPRPRYPPPQPGRMQMPFDPQVQAIHDRLERERVPNLYTLSIADARAADLRATQADAGHGG